MAKRPHGNPGSSCEEGRGGVGSVFIERYSISSMKNININFHNFNLSTTFVCCSNDNAQSELVNN